MTWCGALKLVLYLRNHVLIHGESSVDSFCDSSDAAQILNDGQMQIDSPQRCTRGVITQREPCDVCVFVLQ